MRTIHLVANFVYIWYTKASKSLFGVACVHISIDSEFYFILNEFYFIKRNASITQSQNILSTRVELSTNKPITQLNVHLEANILWEK